jgi:hypothetical protein
MGESLCFFLCRMSGEHTSAVSICKYFMSLRESFQAVNKY